MHENIDHITKNPFPDYHAEANIFMYEPNHNGIFIDVDNHDRKKPRVNVIIIVPHQRELIFYFSIFAMKFHAFTPLQITF